MLMSSSVDGLMSSRNNRSSIFVLRRRLYLELVIRSTSRSGGGCIRERVNCLCLCLACVLCCRYDCLLNVVLDFPCL